MLKIQENIELKKHTVFKIGGPARYFCEIASAEELIAAVSWVKERGLPFFILGAGSNVLVSDKGYDGLIIKNKICGINIQDFEIKAGAGAQMARVVAESVKTGLAGFEWAIGIPGTIGGSARGNAGCFGSEMKDVIESVEVFDSKTSKSYQLKAKSCVFGYRDSVFKHNSNLIILSAALKLKKGDSQKSQKLIADYSKKRLNSQDIGAECAGCIFKNVEWSRKDIDKEKLVSEFPELKEFVDKKFISAGFLIDRLGLKGLKIGGAQISLKHANYFINTGDATAEEVLILMAIAKERIQNRYGIFLENEIQLLF